MTRLNPSASLAPPMPPETRDQVFSPSSAHRNRSSSAARIKAAAGCGLADPGQAAHQHRRTRFVRLAHEQRCRARDLVGKAGLGDAQLVAEEVGLAAHVHERRQAGHAQRDADGAASGLDPHISLANARLQAPRIADERGLDADDVLAVIDDNTVHRPLNFLGEDAVNVLLVNVALDELE